LPAFALGFDADDDHTFHWVLFGLAVPISTLALGAVPRSAKLVVQVGTAGLS
jgi:hypothetical protein